MWQHSIERRWGYDTERNKDRKKSSYGLCGGIAGSKPLHIFKLLEGGEVEIQAAFPAGVIGTTAENLKASAGGEHYEWEEMYPSFARVAQEEGIDDIAKIFESIAVAEKQHEKRYLALLANVKGGTVFKKEKPVVWRCRNCGYLHEGTEAPGECPACAHPQAYFELLGENY